MALCRGAGLEETGKESGQESPEAGEGLADVVPAAAEDGEDGVAEQALEAAAGEATLGFHVADLGLDGAAALEEPGQRRRQGAELVTRQRPAEAEISHQCAVNKLHNGDSTPPVCGEIQSGTTDQANSTTGGRASRLWLQCGPVSQLENAQGRNIVTAERLIGRPWGDRRRIAPTGTVPAGRTAQVRPGQTRVGEDLPTGWARHGGASRFRFEWPAARFPHQRVPVRDLPDQTRGGIGGRCASFSEQPDSRGTQNS